MNEEMKRLAAAIAIAMMLLAGLACNLPFAPSDGEVAPLPTQEPIPTEEGIQPTDEPAPAGEAGEDIDQRGDEQASAKPAEGSTVEDCPEAGEGRAAYINLEGGYCLLYPADFSQGANQAADQSFEAWFHSPVVVESPTEPLAVSLHINVIAAPGAATDITPAQWADEEIGLFPGLEDSIVREELTVGGFPAVSLSGMPGYMTNRVLYIVANDTLYSIMVQPYGDEIPEAVPDAEAVWSTVTETLTFFPPQYGGEVTLPEAVCPAPSAGTTLYVDRREGYCTLLPDGFREDPDFDGSFIGGPEIEGLPGLTQYASLTVGYVGPNREETVREIAERYASAALDPSQVTLEDATVGGYPAVIETDPSGTVPSRTAYVVANDTLYTLLAKPVDPVNYPEAQPDVELIWSTVLETISFFDAWN